jgi:HNH endonuclease
LWRCKGSLSFDHLIPHVRGGPDSAENLVLACKHCNSSDGKKGLYEWYGIDRKDDLPRIVAGKYLKLLYEIHERNGTLNKGDMKGDGKLDVLDLEVY